MSHRIYVWDSGDHAAVKALFSDGATAIGDGTRDNADVLRCSGHDWETQELAAHDALVASALVRIYSTPAEKRGWKTTEGWVDPGTPPG